MSAESPPVPSAVEASAGGRRLAMTVVSYLLNPLVLPPVVYGLALRHVGASGDDVAVGVGIATVFLSVVPLVHVGWMRWRGAIDSLEIRDRRRRTKPFLSGLGASLAAFFLVLGATELTGRALLAALLGCHVLNTLLLFGITIRWKISVHCASMAGAVSTLAFVGAHVPGELLNTSVGVGLVMGGGGILIAVLLWARVWSRAHTLGQAAAGTALGLAAPYLELFVIGASGGL